MSWNNRVMLNKHTYSDNYIEYTATIHEVHYIDEGVSYTDMISPTGSGETEAAALIELKHSLELMLEAVNNAVEKKTAIFDYGNKETHNPGEPSELIKTWKNSVIDPDDEYMDEKYGD